MAAPNTHIKVAGAWKQVNKMYVRVGGSWKLVNKAYVRVGGVWKLVGQGVTPGSTTYTTPGTYSFTVPNHNSLQVELWGAGGGGATTMTAGTAGGAAKWDGGSASGKPQANGGSPGTRNDVASVAGGSAVNGDINTSGGSGQGFAFTTTYGSTSYEDPNPWGGQRRGGNCPNGGLGGATPSGNPNPYLWEGYYNGGNGNAPGGGGCGVYWRSDDYNGESYSNSSGHRMIESGGAGAYCKKTYASGVYAAGASVQVVVPAVAAGGSDYASTAGSGARGQATITWS